MDDFFADKSRTEAKRNWFREELDDPCLKVLNLDQSFDQEFVLSLLRPYVEAFDTMFFSGCLIHYTSLTIVPGADLPGRLGECGLDLKRPRHPICIKIRLPSKQSANRTRRRVDLYGLVAVLLHEMIHAYFQSSRKLHAKDRKERKPIKDIRILGPGGHGVYFQRIADVIERFVQDNLQLPIDMGRANYFGFDLASCRTTYNISLTTEYLSEIWVYLGRKSKKSKKELSKDDFKLPSEYHLISTSYDPEVRPGYLNKNI
jgi:hypothetical protein